MSKVLIIYKSGAQVELECKDFTVTKRGSELTGAEWSAASPRPLHLGLDDIAAIYEIIA